MLRATMEIMSFAKMQQYDDSFFGYRELGKDYASGAEYPRMMEEAKSGWLKKEGENLVLYPCAHSFIKVPLDKILKEIPDLERNRTSWKRNQYIQKHFKSGTLYPFIKREGICGRIVCTGKMDGKKHEFLFSKETKGRIVLTERDKLKFLTVHAPVPDFSEYEKLLDKKGEIAVFYLESDNSIDKVKAIGLSKMIRYPYKYSVKDLVNNQQKEEKGRDLCEIIWGTTEGDSLKGRVQISHAFCDNIVADENLVKVEGILGMPKASYYPLYLTQDKKPYKDYNTADTISGRKRYRIHKSNTPVDLPQPSDHKLTRQLIMFKPLPSGLSFHFRINLHNMRKIEIGAIISALTFHGTAGCYHNLGLAKSQGYGKIMCSDVSLNGLKFTKDEYMSAFEIEMNNFMEKNDETPWSKSRQIKTLIAIAKEHDEKGLSLMKLPQYKESKKYYSQISEKEYTVTSIAELVERERLKQELIAENKREKKRLEEEKRLKEKRAQEERERKIQEEANKKKEAEIVSEAYQLKEAKDYEKAKALFMEAENFGFNDYKREISECELGIKEKEKNSGDIENFLSHIIKLASVPSFANHLKRRKEEQEISKEDYVKIAEFVKEKLNDDQKLCRQWHDYNKNWGKMKDVLGEENANILYDQIFGN